MLCWSILFCLICWLIYRSVMESGVICCWCVCFGFSASSSIGIVAEYAVFWLSGSACSTVLLLWCLVCFIVGISPNLEMLANYRIGFLVLT